MVAHDLHIVIVLSDAKGESASWDVIFGNDSTATDGILHERTKQRQAHVFIMPKTVYTIAMDQIEMYVRVVRAHGTNEV